MMALTTGTAWGRTGAATAVRRLVAGTPNALEARPKGAQVNVTAVPGSLEIPAMEPQTGKQAGQGPLPPSSGPAPGTQDPLPPNPSRDPDLPVHVPDPEMPVPQLDPVPDHGQPDRRI
jgi:hypothetical protein